jgi:hypothetical protein
MITPTPELAKAIQKELNIPDPEKSIAKEILHGRSHGNNPLSGKKVKKEKIRVHGGG